MWCKFLVCNWPIICLREPSNTVISNFGIPPSLYVGQKSSDQWVFSAEINHLSKPMRLSLEHQNDCYGSPWSGKFCFFSNMLHKSGCQCGFQISLARNKKLLAYSVLSMVTISEEEKKTKEQNQAEVWARYWLDLKIWGRFMNGYEEWGGPCIGIEIPRECFLLWCIFSTREDVTITVFSLECF